MITLYNIILYSILGYIFESSLCIINNSNYDSGFTFGPYTLIYGISLTIMFIIYKLIDKLLKKSFINIIISFIISFIILGTLEYFGGYLFEKLFSIVYWSYEDIPLTFGKYFNVYICASWSIASILIYKLLYPKTSKIKKYVNDWFIIIITSIILTDICFSILKLL